MLLIEIIEPRNGEQANKRIMAELEKIIHGKLSDESNIF